MTDLATVPTNITVGHGTAPPRWLGIGQIVLGLGVATSAILGPLLTGAIDYHASVGAVDQIVGGDSAALFLVAPAAILAGMLTLRGHIAGPVIGIAPSVFAAYTYTQLTLGGDFRRYQGNSEDFFVLNLGLFVLGLITAVSAWGAMDPSRLPKTSTRVDRALALFLLAAALFLIVGLHAPQLMALWRGTPPAEYLADPGPFWLVKLMDLGIVAPAMIAAAIGLLAHRSWAHKAKYAVVGWFALLAASVAGMAISMQVTGAPGAAWANVIAFGTFGLAGIGLAIVMFRPLFREQRLRTER